MDIISFALGCLTGFGIGLTLLIREITKHIETLRGMIAFLEKLRNDLQSSAPTAKKEDE